MRIALSWIPLREPEVLGSNPSRLIQKRSIYIIGKIHLTMVEINITRMSSKGQIVIPIEMRKDIKVGEKLIVIRKGDTILLKKAGKLDANLKEDLEFARRTEEAWKRYDRGEFKSMQFDEFLKEMKKW